MSKPSSTAASTNLSAAPSSDGSAVATSPPAPASKPIFNYAAAARSQSGTGSSAASRPASGTATPNLASSLIATAASSSVPSPAVTPSLPGQSPLVTSVSYNSSNAATPASSHPPSKAGSTTGTESAAAKGQVNGVRPAAAPDMGSRDRRTSAIGIPRGHGVKPSASHISFGSLADAGNDPVLSSSPANPPTIARREGAPVFGSMTTAGPDTPTKPAATAAPSSAATTSSTTTATAAPAPTPAKREGGKKKYDFNAGFQQQALATSDPAGPPSSHGSHSPAPSVSVRPDARRGASTYDPSTPSNPTSPRPSNAHLGPPPSQAGGYLSGASPSFAPRAPQGGPPGAMLGYPGPPPGWQQGVPGSSPHLSSAQLPAGFPQNGQSGPAGFMGRQGAPPNFQPQRGPPGAGQMYGQAPGRPPFVSTGSQQNGGRAGAAGGANGPTSPRLPPGAPPAGFAPPGQFWPGPQGPPGYGGGPHQPYYPFAGMPTYPNPNYHPSSNPAAPSPHLAPSQPPPHPAGGPPAPGSNQSQASTRPDMSSRPSTSSIMTATSSAVSTPSGHAPQPFSPYPHNFIPGTPQHQPGPPPTPGSQQPPGPGGQQLPPHQRTASLSFKAPTFSPGAAEFKPTVAFTAPRKSAAIQIKKPTSTPPVVKEDKEKEEKAAKEKLEAEEKAKREAEEKAKAAAEAEAAAAALAAEEAKKKAEEEAAVKKAAEEAAARKKVEEEEAARKKAEEEAARLAEERRRAEEAAEKAKKDAEEKARLEAEAKEKERLESEAAAAAQKATQETEAKQQAEAEAKKGVDDIPAGAQTPPTSLPDPTSLPGLPSKPVNGVQVTPTTKTRPTPIDVSSGSTQSTEPVSTPTSALQAARNIEDLNQVSYPNNIVSPRAELNQDATPGKFRYDRDFLLQFMNVCKEKPDQLPSLEAIGMTDIVDGSLGGISRTQSFGGKGRGVPGGAPGLVRGVSGSSSPMPPIRMGSGTMPMFGPGRPTTSEERFARANAGGQVMGNMAIGSGFLPGRPNAGGMVRPPSGSGLAGPGGREGRRSATGRPRGPKGGPVPPSSLGPGGVPIAPLQMSANSWAAQHNATALEQDSPEMVQRKVKALLNKLTLDKFASISDQVLEWANKSEKETDGRILRQVIALIFEKATDEAHWSSLYAGLCRKLMEMLSSSVKDEGVRDNQGNPVAGGQLFRKYLLNRCQEDYERGWSKRDELVAAAAEKAAEDLAKAAANEKARAEAEAAGKEPAKEAELMSDEYYAAQKAKRQGLGLVRFIGELYKLQMLTERIMHECIKKLLSNIEEPEEEDIESLCRLMTTVGKLLDHDKAHKHVDVYFQRMGALVKNQKLSSRARFMVQDVIEARQNGWVIRNEASGPKLISEIHQEAAAAAADAARAAQMGPRSRPGFGDPMSRGGSRAGARRDGSGFGGVPSADGWAQVGNAPPVQRPSKAGDLSHFGRVRDASSVRANLGPSSSVFANKGRKDGKATPDREPVTTAANPFAALEGAGGEAPQPSLSRRTSQADLAAASRPKLNLAPRTLPMPNEAAEKGEEDEAKEAAASEDGETEEEDELEDIDDEKAKRMIENSVQEWFSVKDVGEGVASFAGLPTRRRPELFKTITEKALDKKLPDVELTAELLGRLVEEKVMTSEALAEAFKAIVEPLEDLSVDNPSVFKFAGILLKGSMLDQAVVEKLAESIEPIDETPEALKERLMEAYASAS